MLKTVEKGNNFMAVDVRIRYTQMIIKKNFIELLKTKHITKISVTELCELSQINRSTFYKHYEDIYDLMKKMTDEIIEEFRLLVKSSRNSGTKHAVIEALENVKQKKEIYMPLFSENSDINIIRSCVTTCYNIMAEESTSIFEGITAAERELIISFLSWGGAGMLRSWLENGMVQPTEEVADIIANITLSTIKAIKE